MKYQTRVITDESQVPAGYVPLSSWEGDRTIHKRLSDLHTSGKIPAVKLMRVMSEHRSGRVWVDEKEALRVLSDIEAKSAADLTPTPAQQARIAPRMSAPCEASNCENPHQQRSCSDSLETRLVEVQLSLTRCVAILGDIYDVMETVARAAERTASAVELIATEPKERPGMVIASGSRN